MDEAERRDVWLAALGTVVAEIRAGIGMHGQAVPRLVNDLRDAAHRAMDEAEHDRERDAMYERHRAFSAILRALQPQDPGV